MKRFAGLFLVSVIAVCAAPPAIRDIAPRGGRPGSVVKLVLKGSDLPSGARLETSIPASVSRLSPPAEAMRPGSELAFLLEVKKDAREGIYPLRVVSPAGVSNVMLFAVEDLPQAEETEASQPTQRNDEIKTAQALALPGAVDGKLGPGDIDVYAISIKSPQRVVVEVEAQALGSAVDPTLEIWDANGRPVARNEDAPGIGVDTRLEFAAKPGTYYARVHDAKYSDQAPNHFYRLKAGSWPYAEALFPLGWRKGEPVKVEALGGNLSQPVNVTVEAHAAGTYSRVSVPGSHSRPQLFVLSEYSEMLEPESGGKAITPGTVINGRIGAKGEVDRYQLAVSPGEEWLFELTASTLGTSRLDALLTVYDSVGKKLASRDDLGSADPVLPWKVPEGVKEVTVAVEDLLGRGGPDYGYRLLARKEPADFTVRLATPFVNVPAGGTALVAVDVQRRGYDGPVRLTIPNLPKGFRQAGGHVAASAAQQRFDDPNPRFNVTRATISISAAAEAEPRSFALDVVGTADTGRGTVTRKAESAGLIVPVKGLRQKAVSMPALELPLLAAAMPAVPAKVSTPVPLVRIAQGVEYPVQLRIDRGPGAALEGRLRDTVASAVGNLRILQGEKDSSPDKVTLLVNTNFATPVSIFDFYTAGTFSVDGRTVEVTSPIIEFEVVPGYQLFPASTDWTVSPGGSLKIAGDVFREPTFEGGLVKMNMDDLPDGVTCTPAEAAADARKFQISCRAEASAAKGEYPVRLVSSAPDTGRRAKDTYKGPEITGKLRIQ